MWIDDLTKALYFLNATDCRWTLLVKEIIGNVIFFTEPMERVPLSVNQWSATTISFALAKSVQDGGGIKTPLLFRPGILYRFKALEHYKATGPRMAVSNRTFHYTTIQKFCQVKGRRQFHQIFSRNFSDFVYPTAPRLLNFCHFLRNFVIFS